MSFLDDIVDVGKAAYSFVSGSDVASGLVKVAGLALLANQINKSAIKNNNLNDLTPITNIDQGVRLQIAPSTSSKIPVLYGSAFFGGNITDAVMTNTNKTMYYCLTLSERTGTKLSDGQPTNYVFKDIYWNNQRIVFNSDGITASYTVDAGGNIDRSLSNQVKIWCYKGNSTLQTIPENYTNTATIAAYKVMPGWTTSTHMMNDLLFAIVKVDYNRDQNVTGIGDLMFHIESTMSLPGDCLYDYMTNTRYGAGITASEILTT